MRPISIYLFAVLMALPAAAQTDDMGKTLRDLQETNKAILKELQEIRKLLAQQAPAAPQSGDALPVAAIDVSKRPFKGSPTAKVALIEFSDYQCSFCARFVRDTYPQLIKDYVDTNKIKYVFRDLPLEGVHPNAFKAAEAAHCGGEQGRFWEMHDQLFANSTNLASPDLSKYAEATRLNTGQFQQCLESGKYTNAVRQEITDAGTLGITGTPSFFIGVVQPNGSVKVSKKLVGAKSFAEFKAVIDTLLTQ